MITFIESGNRIATENFQIGEIYTITYTNGNYKTMCCVGIGSDFVMFQDKLPNALFCLTLGTSETVSTIDLGGGTMNYNELENKPQINGIVLIGNKTTVDLGLVSQDDLASKQDTLTTPQLTAVNSGITGSLVTQITTNQNNILSVYDSIYNNNANGISISDISGVAVKKGWSSLIPNNSTTFFYIEKNNNFDTYVFVLGKNVEIYTKNVTAAYFAITYGRSYSDSNLYNNVLKCMCANPVRLRNTDGNLPTITNKLSLTAGSIVAFTITKGKTELIYGLDTGISVKNSFADEIDKKCYIQYKTGTGDDNSAEWVDIYVPTTNASICYRFTHSIDDTINADVWRVAYAYQCDNDFNIILPLTIHGEWECAIQLSGRDDFSGGILHGDEIQTATTFFINGQKIDITKYTDLTPLTDFRIIETSTLYDANDHVTAIATHGSQHIFNTNGLKISQSIKYNSVYAVTKAYLAMFPISKTVSKYIILNDNYATTPLPTTISAQNVNKSLLYDDINTIANFDMIKYPIGMATTDNVFVCTDNGGNAYNKCYYATVFNNTYTTTANEVWQSETQYSINV